MAWVEWKDTDVGFVVCFFALSCNTKTWRYEIRPARGMLRASTQSASSYSLQINCGNPCVHSIVDIRRGSAGEIREGSWKRDFWRLWSSQNFYMAQEFSELQVADSWEISFLLFFSPRDPLLATLGGQMAMWFFDQGSITVFLELFCPLFKIAARSGIKSNIILIRLHLKNTFWYQ